MKDLSPLVGKTILSAEWVQHQCKLTNPDCDEGDYMLITFTDSSTMSLHGSYIEDYTGNSVGEYPSHIYMAYAPAPTFFLDEKSWPIIEVCLKPEQFRDDGFYYFDLKVDGEFIDKQVLTQVFRMSFTSLEDAKERLNMNQVKSIKQFIQW